MILVTCCSSYSSDLLLQSDYDTFISLVSHITIEPCHLTLLPLNSSIFIVGAHDATIRQFLNDSLALTARILRPFLVLDSLATFLTLLWSVFSLTIRVFLGIPGLQIARQWALWLVCVLSLTISLVDQI